MTSIALPRSGRPQLARSEVYGARYLIAFAVTLASVLELVDTSIVNVAIPHMMGNLGATLDEIAWVSTGYIVANVIILPLTGWLSERLGRRNYYTGSIALFTLASFFCGHAATLHDVGIVGVPGNILSKKRALSDRELELVRKHPFLGAKLMEGVPGMDATRRTILEHHEYFDGSGYPGGLRGEEISLTARILGVAEYFDSIISERPHRGSLMPGEALQLIRNGGNTLFDPAVTVAFAFRATFTSSRWASSAATDAISAAVTPSLPTRTVAGRRLARARRWRRCCAGPCWTWTRACPSRR